MRSWLLCLALASLASAQEPTRPATTKAAPTSASKPVQVFVMLGQSNMLGFGRVGPSELQGTLENLIKEQSKYGFWKRADGSWVVRDDVRYVRVMQRNDAMSVHANEWLTVNGNFGPELGFGHVVGDALDAPVLLLKSCIGNRSLGWDLLPPGSERYEFEGQIYAGYKDSPLSWAKGTEPVPIAWYAGKQYDDDVANAKKVLAELATYYPGAAGYEVAGFVWWQGHKDQNAAHASRYEQNLVQLIKMLRRDFAAPNAKFVLATIAFGGEKLSGHGLQVAEAQLAVDGRRGKYKELVGNVAAIDARPFWREVSVSPVNQGHHYNHNAETYMEVGLAMGRAMVEMLGAAPAKSGAEKR
jgi:alpha-galactosidase